MVKMMEIEYLFKKKGVYLRDGATFFPVYEQIISAEKATNTTEDVPHAVGTSHNKPHSFDLIRQERVPPVSAVNVPPHARNSLFFF